MQKFQESLVTTFRDAEDDRDQYLGILILVLVFLPLISAGVSLREFIHEYRHQTLVLFKCCLLQPKVSIRTSSLGFLFMLSDAILRLAVREIMYDAIRFGFIDTRSVTEVGGLCRSRVR